MLTTFMNEQSTEEKIQRAQKLANGRKQLKKYQVAKTSDPSCPFVNASSSSTSPIPLTTDLTNNTSFPHRSPGGSKLKELESVQPEPSYPSPSMVRSPGKLRKSRSKGSLSHRRQNSSISGGHGLVRGSVLDLFGTEDSEPRAMRAELPRLAPEGIIATPPTPLMEQLTMEQGDEDREAVKSRLTTFSFGTKPPAGSSTRNRPGQPLLPSQLLPAESATSPNNSPSKRLSTPLSRPPSLLLTRPTPLAFGSPTPAGPSRQAESPQTPPTPARTKRHSHTRSNSISLPNLKVGSRPASLGIPSSPSFPSSPSSPAGASRPATQIQGTRLKFEPSGRGAEAEREKDEYRRKALEKLTGSPSPVFPESPGNDIALPDLDDEDGSSVASSARPYSGLYSGFGSFTFGRPNSSSSTPSGYSWSTNEDSPPLDRWSTGFNAKSDDKEDGLGFGFTFSGTGSGSFSFGAIPPQPTYETGLGMGLPSTMPARPSLTRNLSVLAEVDEPEDGDVEDETAEESFAQTLSEPPLPMSPMEEDIDDDSTAKYAPIVAPTPSRLRQLHLVSSNSTPGSARSTGMSSASSSTASPTKGYGAIGRGRPAPPARIKTDSPASASSLVSTPKSAGIARRRDPRFGSRGSSISYKKDNDSSTSSRDWSFSTNTKTPFSPPIAPTEISSPTFSPDFSGWGNMPRSGPSRPCPRPKSLAGLGFDSQGAGRVLGEVEEEDEDLASSRNPSYRLSSESSTARTSNENPRDSFGVFSWRDPQLELEMERDALREDVDLWRQRCGGLEDKLEAEKKENLVLRERVRKLGDRLSSVASYPVTKDRDTSLVADLRTQLFGLQVELDRERNARLSAQDKIHELESELASIKTRPTSISPPIITNIIPPTPMSPNAHFDFPPPVFADPPAAAPTPDPNAHRMKAWGFPRGPVPPSQSRSRESFFGLSQVLRKDSTEEEREHGVDLPPFMLTPESMTDSPRAPSRTVSDPIRSGSGSVTSDELDRRSTSLTSSASTALSFFTDYLPKYSRVLTPPAEVVTTPTKGMEASTSRAIETRGPTHGHESGRLDWRDKCACCQGEVFEL